MNSPWRSLCAAWHENSPALALWPQAAAGLRDWQQALQHATPGVLRIDAWPREPEVALLLAPLAASSLQPAAPGSPQAQAGDGGPRAAAASRERVAGSRHKAASAAERFATSAPGNRDVAAALGSRWLHVGDEMSGAAAALQRSARLGSGLNRSLTGHAAGDADGSADGSADGTADGVARSPVSALATKLAPGAGAARVAAMLAQFSARQRPALHGLDAAAGAAAGGLEIGPRPQAWAGPSGGPHHLAAPAYGNVVPLRGAAGVAARPRAAAALTPGAGGTAKLRQWSSVLGLAAVGRPHSRSGSHASGAGGAHDALRAMGTLSPPDIAAWLARGQHAPSSNAEAPVRLQPRSATGPGTATAPHSSGSPAAPPASQPATTEASRWRGASTWETAEAPPPAPPWADDALAGLAAAMSRIENQLATASPAQAQAPTAPQWLSDDDTLAERIHGILRRQARRHGIATP